MSKLKIGITGGSFNPIHDRHIEMALAAMKEKGLDQMIFLPTGNPPHKREGLADAEHRYRMTRLAAFGLKNCSVSHLELERSGIIYTADTLELLHRQYPDASLFYIIGEDTLHDLPNWHTPEKVFALCKFIVCCRSTCDAENDPIVHELEKANARFSFLTLPPKDISSTDIRLKLEKGLEPAGISPQVLEYIRVFGLYHTPISPKGLAANYERLAALLTEKRLIHSLLVCYTARKLARLHEVDEEKAATAALLHDCAKCLPLEEMQRIVEEKQLKPDESILQNGNLLHGPAGSCMAQSLFGVDDPEILSAITYHTTGHPGMTALELVIYLADKIEPSRKSYPALEKIRGEAKTDLFLAAADSLTSSMEYVKGGQAKPHPLSMETLTWLNNINKNRKG